MTEVIVSHAPFDENGYELIEKLGEGAYGLVSLYWKSDVGFRAVKKFKEPAFRGDLELLEKRFMREVQVLSSISHVAAVHIYAYGIPEKVSDSLDFEPWIEMEFFPTGTLSELIVFACRSNRLPPLSLVDSFITLYGIADVLKVLHAQGSVHRDVKSMNIFLNKDYEPHLGDFGFARLINSKMTRGTYTLIYAAPELLKPNPGDEPGSNIISYGPPVDVWAFGLLIYEVRTGFCPFLAGGAMINDIVTAIINGQNLPVLPDADPFSQLLSRCIIYDPARRPTMSECVTTVSELAENLLSGADLDRFHAYKEKVAQPWQAPAPVTVEDIEGLAQEGIMMPNFISGVFSYYGNLKPRNDEAAAGYFREAAKQEHPKALEFLIDLLESGVPEEEGELDCLQQTFERVSGELNRIGSNSLASRLRFVPGLNSAPPSWPILGSGQC